MRTIGPAFLVFVIILGAVCAAAQGQPDDDKVWSAFAAWARTVPAGSSLQGYREVLERQGLSSDEIQRRVGVIRRFASERVEGVELIYDRIFSQPLTGDPAKDGFTSTPSAFMVEATRALEPGAALDVGAGQGRNAVFLATKGWVVTAIDVSGAGLAATRANAERAGVSVATVKTTYDAFDFGTAKWDLIVMILSWAPVDDPAFVARLSASLRPGGTLVFEHVIQRAENPFPPNVHALGPGQLRTCFGGLRIERYEEVTALGDWGGPPSLLVRMVARKQ